MGDIAEKPDLWSAELPRRAGRSARTASLAEPAPTHAPVPVWQVVTTGAIGVGFVLLLVALAIFFPHPTDFQAFVFRVVLALAAGGLGALIPGFLEFRFRNWLRATGAAAFFALVYLVNPPALIASPESSIQNEAPATESSPVSPADPP